MNVRALAGLVLLGLAVPTLAQEAAGTWSLLENSPEHWYRFDDGSFIDPETGWVVNGDGEVWRTGDGGASWTPLATLPAYLRTVVFLDDQHGFIGTLDQSNVLYETTDGGETFSDITSRIIGPIPHGICGIWAVDEQTIYGVGWWAGPAHFVKTTDGGETWTSRGMSEYVGSLVDVYFWDEQRGIAVGGTHGASGSSSAVVLMTEDGGETWSVRHTSSENGEWSWKITFPTPTTGYVSLEANDGGFPARVLKTTDAGMTWTELTISGSNDLQGLGFVTEDIGWASGRGTTSVTTDGGATWATLDLDGDINRFEFFGDTLGYAMGHRIYKIEREGTPVVVEDVAPAEAFAIEANYPNPFGQRTTIRYRVGEASEVELQIYDVLGRRVATLERGHRPAGEYAAVWDGRGMGDHPVAPGVYLARLTAGDRTATHRLTLLRR